MGNQADQDLKSPSKSKRLADKVRVGEFQTRAAFKPGSYDDKTRTIQVIISSGQRGRRFSIFGDDFDEELEVSDSAIRMDRLKRGAPVLSNHSLMGVPGAEHGPIGVVEDGFIENGNLIGTLRFSKNDGVNPIVNDIADGILRNVSVGYVVHRYMDVTTPTDERQVLRAIDWEPMEVSMVTVPFDSAAQVRNSKGMVQDCEIISRAEDTLKGESLMSETQAASAEAQETSADELETKEGSHAETTEAHSAESSADDADKEEIVEGKVDAEAVQTAERSRATAILGAVKKAELETRFAEELINSGCSVEQAHARIIDAWAEKGSKTLSNKVTIEAGSTDQVEVQKRGIVNAILHRHNSNAFKLTEEGRSFRHMRLWQMAAEVLELNGIKTRGMSAQEIAKKALSQEMHIRAGLHGTTDFPSLLADVANKTLRAAYEQAPQTWRPFCRVVSAPDFKNINRVQLGEAPALAKVPEHGEIAYGTIGDAKETYALASYGKACAITRQAIINDDLDGFSRIPALFGRSAANLESDLVYSILNLNANMGDGVALFHANHGNLGTTGAISDTTLGEMRKLGRLQTGLDGATLLNIMYEFLIVPPSKETLAQKQLGLVQPDSASNVNPFSNLYRLIVEPRLESGTVAIASSGSSVSWYAVANPAQIDTIEVCYLEGGEGVRIESDVEFSTDGVLVKAMHDVAAKAIDHRGLFKNAGA